MMTIIPSSARTLSGLEYLRAIARGELPAAPIAVLRVATAQGRLTDEAGRLYAHGVTTCMLFRAPSPGAKEG